MTKSATKITSTSSKGKHLTYANRCRIETLLSEGYSIRYIADSLCVSPSAVSREIKQHIKRTKSHSNDCINKSDCVLQHICCNASCRRHCKTCNLCVKYCPDYEATHCITLSDGMVFNKRPMVYFCDSNRSDQKGHCENNHRLFRDIVPKVTSIDSFMQADMVKATNHINSYRRKSLYGKSPYDYAYTSLPNDFFIFLGLEQIPSEEVMLTPELLKHSNSSK